MGSQLEENIGKCQLLKHSHPYLLGRELEKSEESAISDKTNFPHHGIHSFQSFYIHYSTGCLKKSWFSGKLAVANITSDREKSCP